MSEMQERNQHRTGKPFGSLLVRIEYKHNPESDSWKFDRTILARIKQISAEGPVYGSNLITRYDCHSLNAVLRRVQNRLYNCCCEIVFEFGPGFPETKKVVRF
jgi:hypothetical protein